MGKLLREHSYSHVWRKVRIKSVLKRGPVGTFLISFLSSAISPPFAMCKPHIDTKILHCS